LAPRTAENALILWDKINICWSIFNLFSPKWCF